MTIEFQLTFDDFREAQAAEFAELRTKALRGLRPFAISVLLFVVAVAFLWLEKVTLPESFAQMVLKTPLTWGVALFIGVLIFVSCSRGRLVRAAWNKSPHLQLHKRWDIDAQRIITEDEQTRVEMKWTVLKRCRETPNLFLLYTSEHAFHVVPKRALATDVELNEFCKLVRGERKGSGIGDIHQFR